MTPVSDFQHKENQLMCPHQFNTVVSIMIFILIRHVPDTLLVITTYILRDTKKLYQKKVGQMELHEI